MNFKELLSRISAKKVYLAVAVLTLILLTTAFVLGMYSAQRMRDIISEQFNQQQLTIAKSVSSDLREKFRSLKRELHTLHLSPSIQYLELSWANRMRITYDNVAPLGVVGIGFLEAQRRKIYWVEDRKDGEIIEGDFNAFWNFCCHSEVPGEEKILLLRSGLRLKENLDLSSFLILAIPTYQVSVDATHPQATGELAGCLFFLLNPYQLIKGVVKDIRSGQSGYAWVIDQQGIFLYHPEESFIGKSAFEVREKKAPKISFAEINRIQREKMLAGEEGTSWYVSGWHRGVEQEIKKFIAYAPIILEADNEKLTWSVAVVAPQTEVEGVIHDIYFRQFLLQGVILFIILLGGATIIYYESRWSAALEEEVRRQTAALERSKNELAKSEKLYKSVVESAEDAIFTVDAKGVIISINRHGAKMLGYTPQGIIGKNLQEIFSSPMREQLSGLVQEVFQEKKGRRITTEFSQGDRKYWINLNLTPIRGEDDRVLSVLIIAHDLTSQKKMEEQLYHTEKLASLGQLAAGVAHEINNPLAIILGFADMLCERLDPSSKEYEMAKTIERQGHNCKKIVENLMTFARCREKEQYDTDINRAIETVMEVVKNTLLTKKVRYELQLAEGLPRVRGDAVQLQQVFLNIITNAVLAMPQGGLLTVTTRLHPDGKRVEILFSDTGVGIKKEHLPRIYDPFFTTRKVGEGTGLGLSVSYAIITKFGGTISCESRTKEEYGEQSGTTFTITLPIAQTPAEEQHEAEARYVSQDSYH